MKQQVSGGDGAGTRKKKEMEDMQVLHAKKAASTSTDKRSTCVGGKKRRRLGVINETKQIRR